MFPFFSEQPFGGHLEFQNGYHFQSSLYRQLVGDGCEIDGNTYVYDTKLSIEAIIELESCARHLEFKNGCHL